MKVDDFYTSNHPNEKSPSTMQIMQNRLDTMMNWKYGWRDDWNNFQPLCNRVSFLNTQDYELPKIETDNIKKSLKEIHELLKLPELKNEKELKQYFTVWINMKRNQKKELDDMRKLNGETK